MDAAGIDMQIVSLTAPASNNWGRPKRFRLPPKRTTLSRTRSRSIRRASAASRRCRPSCPTRPPKSSSSRVRGQKFAGAIINGHNRGRYLDDRFFWPILESAEQLGAPFYLHPTRPAQPVIDASFGGFSPLVSEIFLPGPGWGWHIETAVHVIRLILGGVFDRFPNLQIVIGHLGEGLPGMFQRLDIMPPAITKLKRPVYLLSARKHPLHLFRLLFSVLFSRAASGTRRRLPRDVLSRSSLSIHGRRTRLLGAIAGNAPPTRSTSPTATRRSCSNCKALSRRRNLVCWRAKGTGNALHPTRYCYHLSLLGGKVASEASG